MSTFSTVYLFQGQNASVLTAYTGILCFIFLFNLFIYYSFIINLFLFVLFCFSCLPFSFLSSFYSDLVPCLPFPLFHAWNISFFLYHGQERNVFLTSFFHACLLISRTGILSTFFTLRIFVLLQHMQDFFVSFCLLVPRLSTFSSSENR